MTGTTHRSQTPLGQPSRPILVVLSGLSGVGKDAILNRMKESGYPLEHIITTTTRPRRAVEKNHTDYHFVSREKFQQMIEDNELLEWAVVYGNYYGVPRKPVKQALDKGQDVVIKVDVQGVATIKGIVPQAVFIFLTPPSIDDIILRLKKRRTESPAELAVRTQAAEEELKQLPLFDYVVFNRQDEIDRAVTDISAIIAAEKCRVNQREITL
ncbi:guanylate kinase [Chloroflexota bacterium]